MKKFGVRNLAGVLRIAFSAGLITQDGEVELVG